MIQTFYTPLLSIFFIAVFLFVLWYLIKDLFLLLYVGRSGILPNHGSDNYSRDQILEMQSYCHSSPRCSYVTSMSEGAMHRIAI